MRHSQFSNGSQQPSVLVSILERVASSIIPDEFCGTLMSGHPSDWSFENPAANQARGERDSLK